MFDLEYNPGGAFIPLVMVMKNEVEVDLSDVAKSEDLEETNSNVEALSEAVETQAAAISEVVEATEENKAAIEELEEKIKNVPTFDIKVVDVLPESGEPGTIYLVKDEETGQQGNFYHEYVYADDAWEEIGPMIDLGDYATIEQVDAAKAEIAIKDAEQDDVLRELASGLSILDDVKADMSDVETLIANKEAEIYGLTKIVGDLGGAVTYDFPGENGKSFNTLMGNNGTVKLTDDVTTGRYGPGVTAKNTVVLNLNSHNLTITGAGSSAAIQARGTQNITIGGKGTIDAGDSICIMANGTASLSPIATINLSGSTTVYRTNRSGGELIYCYVGLINITNGTFRNDGEDKGFTLNCYDANYKNGTANIVVSSTSKSSGPKFYDFNPADNNAEGEHTNFVAEGCEVQISTVVEDGVEHTVYMVVKSA